MKEFARKSLEEEFTLVTDKSGNFLKLKEYLRPLVHEALSRFKYDRESVGSGCEEILDQVPLAAERFLSHGRYKEKTFFSVYFTWYIAQYLHGERNEGSPDT